MYFISSGVLKSLDALAKISLQVSSLLFSVPLSLWLPSTCTTLPSTCSPCKVAGTNSLGTCFTYPDPGSAAPGRQLSFYCPQGCHPQCPKKPWTALSLCCLQLAVTCGHLSGTTRLSSVFSPTGFLQHKCSPSSSTMTLKGSKEKQAQRRSLDMKWAQAWRIRSGFIYLLSIKSLSIWTESPCLSAVTCLFKKLMQLPIRFFSLSC